MMRSSFWLTVAAVVAVTSACDESAPSSMTVRDSAGVRIVEHGAQPLRTTSLRLSSEPIYRFGHRESDHLFSSGYVGRLLPDGGAVVLDGLPPGQQILLLSADGRLRSVLARGGRGPEELGQATSLIVRAPDTVLVQDILNQKLLLFADTTFLRGIGTASNPTVGRGLGALGIDADGRLLMTTRSFNSAFTVTWLPGQLVTVDQETLGADTIGSYEMASFRPREGPRNPIGTFGRVTVSGGEFVHARSDVPALVWRGADGRVRQIVRWTPELRYPAEGDTERLMESLEVDLRRVNPGIAPDELDQMMARQRAEILIPPDFPYPLFRELRGDGEGGVWLAEFEPGFGPLSVVKRHHAIAANGTWLGPVEMPERFRVLDVANGRVLGVLSDELGVESGGVRGAVAATGSLIRTHRRRARRQRSP